MKLLFATHNNHKLLEMSALLLPHVLSLPSQNGIDFSFEENGTTFCENALGKAMHLYQLSGQSSLADDSGIAVDYLNGEPGIYSARYGQQKGSPQLSDSERNAYLLKQMENVPLANRSARFICSIALVLSPSRIFVVQESLEGHLAFEPAGDEGFGYDPIFVVGSEQKTMALLGQEVKNSISHRALAAKRMLSIIDSIEQEKITYVC